MLFTRLTKSKTIAHNFIGNQKPRHLFTLFSVAMDWFAFLAVNFVRSTLFLYHLYSISLELNLVNRPEQINCDFPFYPRLHLLAPCNIHHSILASIYLQAAALLVVCLRKTGKGDIEPVLVTSAQFFLVLLFSIHPQANTPFLPGDNSFFYSASPLRLHVVFIVWQALFYVSRIDFIELFEFQQSLMEAASSSMHSIDASSLADSMDSQSEPDELFSSLSLS